MGLIVVGVIVLLVSGLYQALKYRDPLYIVIMLFFVFAFILFMFASVMFGG